jgi:cysteine-rich repeat protein
MRTSGTVTIGALWLGLVAGTAVVGCSSDSKENGKSGTEGEIGLKFDVAPGVVVNVVTYTITGNGQPTRTGTINVSDPAATVSALIGGLPPSPASSPGDYTIALNATSLDTVVSCVGSATFDVIAGAQTDVNIDMQCSAGETRGEVEVNGTFNLCPTLTSWIAAPLTVSTSGEVAVSAAASDTTTDGMTPDTLTFAWTATGGSFDAPGSASTNFNCFTPGAQILTVTVTDSSPGGTSCSDSATIAVNCVDRHCGNGVIDPDEYCDPPNGTTCLPGCRYSECGDGVLQFGETCDDGNVAGGDNCPADCTLACGDGVLESPETCDDGNTVGGDTCPASCIRISECGDGVVDSGEMCDDGNRFSGDGCESDCTLAPPPTLCGNGSVEIGEECERGTANPNGSPTCSNDCSLVATQACVDCETGADGGEGVCFEFPVAGCFGGADPDSAIPATSTASSSDTKTKSASCYDVLECVRETGCGTTNSLQSCYCGALAPADCEAAPNSGAGAPNGPCKELIEEGVEAEAPNVVLQRMVGTGFAGGWAMARRVCQKSQCFSQCFTP